MWSFALLLFPIVFNQQIKWNYYAGGNDWHQIWPTCKSTTGQQSPIDIEYKNAKVITQAVLYFESFAKNVVTSVENNGYFLKSDFPWMVFQVNDHTGRLRKAQCFTVSFHAPSEHTIEGSRFEMEMQFTCEDIHENAKYLNIALMIESERFIENEMINKFSTAAINLKHAGAKAKISLNFEEAFKQTLTKNNIEEYYTYTGSFTSPPCHKSVEWVIFTRPIKISVQSLSHFTELWAGNQDFAGGSGNYRNIQLLKMETKFIKGKISQNLKPVDLVSQINKDANHEDTESVDFHQKKIKKQLEILEGQRKLEVYKIKFTKKAELMEKQIQSLKHQLKQELMNDLGGSNADILNEKLRQKQVELEKFLENCKEYNPKSECDVELPSKKLGALPDDILDDKNKKQLPAELQGLNLKKGEQVLLTHDGQEIEMKIPEELEFIQISQNGKGKLRRNNSN